MITRWCRTNEEEEGGKQGKMGEISKSTNWREGVKMQDREREVEKKGQIFYLKVYRGFVLAGVRVDG